MDETRQSCRGRAESWHVMDNPCRCHVSEPARLRVPRRSDTSTNDTVQLLPDDPLLLLLSLMKPVVPLYGALFALRQVGHASRRSLAGEDPGAFAFGPSPCTTGRAMSSVYDAVSQQHADR